MQELEQFNNTRFNALPEIEKADAEVRSSGELSLALSVLGPIFVKHGVHESWGLSLLHKHWNVERNELPIQDVKKMEAPVELESKPRRSFGKPFSPSVFAIKNTTSIEAEPLEFSADKSVAVANRLLQSNGAFVQDFGSTITRLKLQERFGLIATREPTPGYDLVEFNFVEPVSIVRETAPRELEGRAIIETSWRFSPDIVGGKCTKSCFSRCIVPASGGSHQHAHTPVHAPQE